jgi:8-oxo-dGTP pyrophosphatase MutT (NUDIX family)
VATPIGFEPTISTLTGWRVKPGYTTGPRTADHSIGVSSPLPPGYPAPMPRRRPNEVSAGGVLARPSGRSWEVCLVRAGRYWGLPKGHIEAGESPVQAALREISEECGVLLEVLSINAALPSSEYVYRRAGTLVFKLVHHFLVTAPAGTELTPQAAEIDEAEWLSFEEASARASFADTRSALAAARDALAAPSA